jgi:hypothetical protein
MSLPRNAEICFRELLKDIPVYQVLLSQENQNVVLSGRDINIQAMGGSWVSPKSRNVRLRVQISVRTSADKDLSSSTDPADDHALAVDLVQQALNDSPTGLVALLNQARDTLNADLPLEKKIQFTAFGFTPVGELPYPKPPEERAIYDAWAYVVTCAEGIAS